MFRDIPNADPDLNAPMHTFFHGWRRKAGVVSLVMACIVAGVWGRSRFVLDDLVFTTRDRQLFVGSTKGHLSFVCIARQDELTAPFWATVDIRHPMYNHFVTRSTAFGPCWEVDYWKIVGPLTLLSAYLILWKPRKRA